MELLLIVRALWDRRRLVAAGVPFVVVLALLASHLLALSPPRIGRMPTTSGVAAIRVLLDTPQSQMGDLAPPGGDAVPTRAVLLAGLMSTSDARDRIARIAGIPPGRLEVEAFTAGPALATPLARAVEETTAKPDEPYVVNVRPDDALPAIAIDTAAPDARTGDRLARGAVAAMGAVAVPSSGEGYVVRALGSPRTVTVTSGAGRAMALAVAVVAVGLWCVAVLLLGAWGADRRDRGRRVARPRAEGASPADQDGATALSPRSIARRA